MKYAHTGPQSFRRMLCISVAVAGLALGGALTACGSSRGSLQAGHTPAVLHLGAGQSGRNATAAGAADSKMMAIRPVQYVFDGALPDLGASASAYSVGGKVATAAFVEQLAKAFGVAGAAAELPSDQGGGWRVGPADYTAPVVMAGQWGMQQWSYSSPAAATAGVSCTVASPPEGTTVPPDAQKCADPAPIADLPTEAGAIAEAKRLLGAMGLDAAAYQFTSYASSWNISVNGSLTVDGMATDLNVSFTFGAKAEVQYAGGTLGTVSALDSYPIVSVADGVKRLGDPTGPWYAFGGPMVMARAGVAVDTAGGVNIATAPTIPVPSGADVAPATAPMPPVSAPVATMPVTDVTVSPVPSNTVPLDTTPYVVHLTGVKVVLSSVYQADGSQLLLPAFDFTASDGSEYRVLAVDAAFLDTSSTTGSSVPPATAVGGGTGSGSSSGSSGSGGGTVGSIAVPTPGIGTIVLVSFDDAKQLAGLSLDKAKALAAEKGWEIRVAEEDGTTNTLTADLRPNRVNVIVKAGVVFDIMSVG